MQDFLVVPVAARSFAEAIEIAGRVGAGTAEVMVEAGHTTALIADEGALDRCCRRTGCAGAPGRGHRARRLRARHRRGIAIDVAATQFHDPATGDYHLAAEDRRVTAAELVAELSSWAEKLPILSIEDVLAEDDCDGWVDATREPAGISCSATT